MKLENVPVERLRLEDQILLIPHYPYGWATVVSIEHKDGYPDRITKVEIARPYISVDTEHGTNPKRVIVLTGLERMTLFPGGNTTYEVNRYNRV